MKQSSSKVNTWITFIGVVMLLIGIYATVRTLINVSLFPKYPMTGVLSFNFSGTPPYTQREQDCLYPQTYYTSDGQKTREATQGEKEREKEQQNICLQGISETRESTKINDISQSLLFLFLGAGILIARRIFFE